ncbi:MAG: tetratricopeptide repeat protein [Bryobacterales bacterium]|nr:tetratricopeptide repeat protein [Bryobacterales bacterium]
MTFSRLDLAFLLPFFCVAAFAGQESRVTATRGLQPKAESRQVPPKAAAEFRKSQSAFDDGKIDKALQHLRNGIALDPGNTDAYNDLGVIYFNINQPERAIEAFSTMIEIEPDCFRAHVNLAYTLNAQQRYKEAERIARRGVELKKMDLKIRYMLGMALSAQRKNLDEAADNLSMAAEEFPEARLELSRMLVEKGEFDRAMQELQRFTQERKLSEKAGIAPAQLFAK